jgi:uncharacterized membrane protein YkvA (DUF1232 family)
METRKAKNTEGKKVSYVGNLVEKASYFIKNPDELNNILNEAFSKASVESDNKAIRKMSEMVQTLFRMTKASFSGEYTALSKGKVFLGLAAIAYFIAPKDLIPDKIPFVGVLDDMAVLAWFIKAANEEIIKFKEWEGTAEYTSTKEVSPAY